MTRADALRKLCWSADVPDYETMVWYLDAMPELEWIKMDRAYAYKGESLGLKACDKLADRGLKVFGDGKFIEVPHKVGDMTDSWNRHPFAMVNCMGGALSTGFTPAEAPDPGKVDGLYLFADKCRAANILPCGVTVLTSKSPEMVAKEFNGRTPVEQVLFYVEWMVKFGFTDIVCSAKEIKAILAVPEFVHLSLNIPGVRTPGADQNDQTRVDTPANAIKNGAKRVVCGTEITGKVIREGDPAERFEKIVQHLMTAA